MSTNTLVKMMLAGDREAMLIHMGVDELYNQWNMNKGERSELHASSILAPETGAQQLCYREQIFNLFFHGEEAVFDIDTIRTFYIGWVIHMGYQSLWKKHGHTIEIEKTHIDPIWKLYHTPDLIVRMHGDIIPEKRYIVEIKTMSDKIWQEHVKKNTPPTNAVRQAQLYMHMRAVYHAIILIHNKNTSEHYEWVIAYDPLFMQPFIKRLNIIKDLKQVFEESERVPKKISLCSNPETPRARKCPFKNVCFSNPEDRKQYRRAPHTDEEQVNFGASEMAL